LAIGAKRKIIELVNDYPIDMDGLCTRDEPNVISLGSYDCLISMDWVGKNHFIMNYYNKLVYWWWGTWGASPGSSYNNFDQGDINNEVK